jgi:hypothetical protein
LPRTTVERIDNVYWRLRGKGLPRSCHDDVAFSTDGIIPARLFAATASGLVYFDGNGFRRLLKGFFFGLTAHDGRWYAFRKVSEISGQLVSFRFEAEVVDDLKAEKHALSPGMHQIDAFRGRLWALDTANNRLLIYRFTRGSLGRAQAVYPAGRAPRGRTDPNYVHMNSVFCAGGGVHLVYHNHTKITGRASQIAVLDDRLDVERVIDTPAGCAHNLALWQESLVFCDSLAGSLVVGDGAIALGDFTRGLALVDGQAIVGGSRFAHGEDRVHGSGRLFVCDLASRQVTARIVLEGVGSVYEVRSLDPPDQAMSANAISAAECVTAAAGG